MFELNRATYYEKVGDYDEQLLSFEREPVTQNDLTVVQKIFITVNNEDDLEIVFTNIQTAVKTSKIGASATETLFTTSG